MIEVKRGENDVYLCDDDTLKGRYVSGYYLQEGDDGSVGLIFVSSNHGTEVCVANLFMSPAVVAALRDDLSSLNLGEELIPTEMEGAN